MWGRGAQQHLCPLRDFEPCLLGHGACTTLPEAGCSRWPHRSSMRGGQSSYYEYLPDHARSGVMAAAAVNLETELVNVTGAGAA
jgi:hypothetical protein